MSEFEKQLENPDLEIISKQLQSLQIAIDYATECFVEFHQQWKNEMKKQERRERKS